VLAQAKKGGFLMVSLKRPRTQAGQGLAEYALILGLIAIAAVASLLFMGGMITNLLSAIGVSL
jgi:Flp pilus assembly pilin Flp